MKRSLNYTLIILILLILIIGFIIFIPHLLTIICFSVILIYFVIDFINFSKKQEVVKQEIDGE